MTAALKFLAAVVLVAGETRAEEKVAAEKTPEVSAELKAKIEGWIKALGADDYAVRERATEALTQAGKNAAPFLKTAAKEGDAETRTRAARILDQVEPPPLPKQASADGKYRNLLKKVHAPQDQATYGDFSDYGHYTGANWAGETNLPPGYWVYVFPNWYIWGEEAQGGGAQGQQQPVPEDF